MPAALFKGSRSPSHIHCQVDEKKSIAGWTISLRTVGLDLSLEVRTQTVHRPCCIPSSFRDSCTFYSSVTNRFTY